MGFWVAHQAVMAHDGHQHQQLSAWDVLAIAHKTLSQLTEKDAGIGRLPMSWTQVPADAVKLHKKGQGYYIVAATNAVEAKTLYLLLSEEDGAVYDVNYTGEFKKLKNQH